MSFDDINGGDLSFMNGATGLAEALLGFDGFRVFALTENPDEAAIMIETAAGVVGCPRCGVRALAKATPDQHGPTEKSPVSQHLSALQSFRTLGNIGGWHQTKQALDRLLYSTYDLSTEYSKCRPGGPIGYYGETGGLVGGMLDPLPSGKLSSSEINKALLAAAIRVTW